MATSISTMATSSSPSVVPNPLSSLWKEEDDDMNTFLVHLLNEKNGNDISLPPLSVPSFLEVLPKMSSQVSLEDDNTPIRPMVSPVASPTLQSFSTSSQTLMLTSAISPLHQETTDSSKRLRMVDIAPKHAKKAKTLATHIDSLDTQAKSCHPTVPAAPQDVDEEQARKERNRFHAQMSRMRKKSLQEEMQEALSRLHEENTLLRNHIATRLGHTGKADSMIQAQKDAHTNVFVAQLQQTKNRIVKGKTLRFLRRLRKNLPASSVYKAAEDGVGYTNEEHVAITRTSFPASIKNDQADAAQEPFQVVA